MNSSTNRVIIVYDNRDLTNSDIAPFVGTRRYGEIIYQRQTLKQKLIDALPLWAQKEIVYLENNDDVQVLRAKLEGIGNDVSLFVMSSAAGIINLDGFTQLIERLPYAEEDFTDRRYKPLVCFFKSSKKLLDAWQQFLVAPIHTWTDPWLDVEQLSSVDIFDLSTIQDFLMFISGATEARHFNAMSIGTYFYTKTSTDKQKIAAEYTFFNLVPESMQVWLVQPFDFKQTADSASYKMMRYYLADAALQWVHSAFTPESFERFIERVLFFINERPKKPCPAKDSLACADALYLEKLDKRFGELINTAEGKKIDALLSGANPALNLANQITRLKTLYTKYRPAFAAEYLVVGHGDPCFSNTLYDQQRSILKFIDPKGAVNEADIWTHHLYDLAKISHSVMGNYDFINNGLFELTLDNENNIQLATHAKNHAPLKAIFLSHLKRYGYDWRHVRLAEATLFLSMLPLHIDHPKKVVAFVLTAAEILDEIENDK